MKQGMRVIASALFISQCWMVPTSLWAEDTQQVIVDEDGSVRIIQVDPSGRRQTLDVDSTGRVRAEETRPVTQPSSIVVDTDEPEPTMRAGALEVTPAPGQPITVQTNEGTVQIRSEGAPASGSATGTTIKAGALKVKTAPGQTINVQGDEGSVRLNPDGSIVIEER